MWMLSRSISSPSTTGSSCISLAILGGALLGIIAITEHPERYHAFIGVGQFVNAIEQERISLHYALDYLKRKGDMKCLAKLTALGEPP